MSPYLQLKTAEGDEDSRDSDAYETLHVPEVGQKRSKQKFSLSGMLGFTSSKKSRPIWYVTFNRHSCLI